MKYDEQFKLSVVQSYESGKQGFKAAAHRCGLHLGMSERGLRVVAGRLAAPLKLIIGKSGVTFKGLVAAHQSIGARPGQHRPVREHQQL